MLGSRKNRPLRPFTWLLLLGAVAFAAGCSTAESPGGSGTNMNHILPSGSSVAGWLVVPTGGSHASTATLDYIAGGGASGCTQCHGSDLTGGISKVSCFGTPAGCHHTPVANWATPAVHGAAAKKAPGSSGFASCQICHGNTFSGRLTAPACADCHGVSAPHPARPWRGPTFTHTNTNPSNAPVCARCHFPGSPNNPAGHPSTPAPAGTPPGCFNSTLCHGAAAGHPAGWVAVPPAPQPHGTDAKAASGFPGCQTCHGSNFAGTASSGNVSCFNNAACHGATATWPHAPAPWRASAGSTYTHTTTVETGNAAVCAVCHFPGSPNNPANHPPTPAPAGTAPGCFNSTLCHGTAGAPHPVGATWVATPPAAQPHGNGAKAAPGAAAGYSYCQVCHGTGTTSPANFGGGSSGVSCYPCHGVNAPHASAPWRSSAGSTYNHTSSDTANAPVCQQCHFPGSPNNPASHPPTPAPAGTAPGCFNNTLCHGAGGAPHPVPYNDSSHFAVTTATFPASCGTCHAVTGTSPVSAAPLCTTCHVAASPLTALNCTSCHASPPSGGAPAGAAYPNIAGAHSAHVALASAGTPISCDTCHTGLGAFTLNHYNRAKARVAPGEAALLAAYNARTVPFSFDNTTLSCTNVSCHGGQATPNWQTGTLDVNAQCTNCHVFGPSLGNPQYNSPFSGEHNINVSHRTCTNCHNTTTLATNHFTNLATTAMEGPASATIGGGTTLIPAGNYLPATRSCTPACHGNQTW